MTAKRHAMRLTAAVTRVAYGCADCEFVVPRDASGEPMAYLDAHVAAFPEHVVVVEERTTRNYESKRRKR